MTPEFDAGGDSPLSHQLQSIAVAFRELMRKLRDKELECDQLKQEKAQWKSIETEEGHKLFMLEARLSFERLPPGCRCGGISFDVICRRCGENLPYEAM